MVEEIKDKIVVEDVEKSRRAQVEPIFSFGKIQSKNEILKKRTQSTALQLASESP